MRSALMTMLVLAAGCGGPHDGPLPPAPDGGCADGTAADAGGPEDAGVPQPGLEDSLVVCQTCAPDLLRAKTEGIRIAMSLERAYAGADVLPQYAPITFHLDGDATCGTAADMIARYGYLTGFSGLDANGKGYVCLFDIEKTNRALPFTPENADTLADQLLPVHEAGHVWFYGRESDYAVQEPFVKMISFVLSGAYPDPCTQFRVTSPPDSLIADLCDAGMTIGDLPAILSVTAASAAEKGRPLSNAEFAGVVSGVVGHDVTSAFVAAGVSL